MPRTSVLKDAACLADLKAEWQELVEQAPDATPFQTWEWQSTWYGHFGRSKRPHVWTLREGNDLIGLMPMTESRGPWRALRSMGSGPSDVLQPLARDGHQGAVATAFAEHISNLKNVDVVDLHQIRADSPLGTKFPQAIPQAACLLLDLPTTYDAFLQTLSKSLRYDCRRMDKEGFKGEIRDVGPADVQAGMDWLFETHKMRWRKRGLPGAFVGKAHGFHREWAAKAAANGWLWLSTMSVDGKPVGGLYAMRLHGTCYFYQAGFDPAFSSISPGTLLVAHTIRKAIEEGLATFDFMRGDEPYKRRWKPQRSVQNLRLLMPGQGVAGKLGNAWNHAGFKIETKIRARLEGRGLTG